MATETSRQATQDAIVDAVICLAGTAFLHFAADVSWGISIAVPAAYMYVHNLRDDLRDLKFQFSIADAELVRVSSLATHLEQEVSDLRQSVSDSSVGAAAK